VRRYAFIVPFAIAVAVLILVGAYLFVIPRTGLEVRTVYHETPGGGGTGGTINVNVLFTNKGNREIEDLKVQAQVLGPGSMSMDSSDLDGMSISPNDNAEIKMAFTGSQYDTYMIMIHIRYESRGQTVVEDLKHITAEDEMNLVFVERI